MTSSSALPSFQEIRDLYVAAQLRRAPLSLDIDVLTLSGEASRSSALLSTVGAHRRGFFQFTYLISDEPRGDMLLAAGPAQVLTSTDYLRPRFAKQRGYTLLFKSGVLAHQLASPSNEFPFFCLPASLELPVSTEWRGKLIPQLQAIAAVAEDRSPYQAQRLSALIAALLYDARWIYEKAEISEGEHRLCTQLVCRFDEVVLNHFSIHHAVGDYARLMKVSADHLSAEVKEKTGRNARDIIAERLIAEAKYRLNYTELTIGQIADQLGFSEPTHFTRFFKRHVGGSPQVFRRRMLRSPGEPAMAESAAAG